MKSALSPILAMTSFLSGTAFAQIPASTPGSASPAVAQPSTASAAEDRAGQAPVPEFDAQRSANRQNPVASDKMKAMAKGTCGKEDTSRQPGELCKRAPKAAAR